MSASDNSNNQMIGSLPGEQDDEVTVAHDDAAPGTILPMARSITRAIERAVREILLAVGEDPGSRGLKETPAQVADVCRAILRFAPRSSSRHLKKFFTERLR